MITEKVSCIIFEIVWHWNFLHGFIVPSYHWPLCWQRTNDGYPSMSDGILERIFCMIHRTILLSLGVAGSWILFFCAQSITGQKMKQLSVDGVGSGSR